MKPFLLITAVFFILLPSITAQNSISSFYHQQKRKEGVQNLSLPGWLIWLGSGLAFESVRNEEIRSAMRFAKKIKKLRFMATEQDDVISAEEVSAFVHNIRGQSFEDLIYVRDETTTINIMVKEKRDMLKELVILVHDDGEFVFAGMRSRIKVKDLVEVIDGFLQKRGWQEEIPARKKKKKGLPPQA